jgi:hypothetical protein
VIGLVILLLPTRYQVLHPLFQDPGTCSDQRFIARIPGALAAVEEIAPNLVDAINDGEAGF